MSDESVPWPFDQPPNCAALTTHQVIGGVEGILEAHHDADDHGWQFFGTSGGTLDNASIVSLQEIIALDPTVSEVADLPVGWRAVRLRRGEGWERTPLTNTI